MWHARSKGHARKPGYHDYTAVLIVLLLAGALFLIRAPFGSGSDGGAGQTTAAVATAAPDTVFTSIDSVALGRELPLDVFLPPGYSTSARRYPVLYMLHGMGGTNKEWENYGLLDQANRLMLAGEIQPFIIVLPQGDYGYWVDQADGGPRWGEYVAREVVADIDSRYRTLTEASARAIGGLSMGADGALQLALNNPDVFSVVGAHSPVLKPYADAPAFFGDVVYFEAHYPVSLVQTETQVAKNLKITIDTGDADIWLSSVEAFHDELRNLGIEHEWHVWSGEHNADYWTAHVVDNLHFYSRSLRGDAP